MERLAPPKHVSRGGLALALGHDPMFDANGFEGMRIGPARNVARGVDAGNAGFQIGVDGDAPIDRQPGLLGQSKTGPHADANHHDIGLDRGAAFQNGAYTVDRGDGVAEMEDDAMLFMQGADEVAHLRPQHAFHRPLLQADDVNLDISGAQRGSGFEPDKARADHDCPPRAIGQCNDGAGISQRAQHVHMRLVRARYRQPHRLRAGRQQQPVVRGGLAASRDDMARAGVN